MERITQQIGNKALSAEYKPSQQDDDHQIWIRAELGRLELEWGRKLGDYQAEILVSKLAKYGKETLSVAFRKMADSWSAKRFQWPLFADFEEIIHEPKPAVENDVKRTLCPESCRCGGSGFIYGKYTKRNFKGEMREYDGVWPCPERIKKASQSA